MSGCANSYDHAPHSWRDGPRDDYEWCDGRGADEAPLSPEEIESYEAAESADDLYARGAYDE